MTRVRVKGFKVFTDRHGKPRCYHRASGAAIDLAAAPIGSAEFLAECARITALTDRAGPPKPGTLGKLVTLYRAAPAFTDLAPRTRKDYARVLDYVKPIADTSLAWFTTPRVVLIRDKAATNHGWRFGNYVRAVLSLVFAWGVERGHLPRNPAASIRALKRPKGAPEANRPWTDAERAAVLDALPPHLGVPIAVMMFTGLDPQDALALPKGAIRDGHLDTARGKTGEAVWVPLPSPLVAILDDAPDHDAPTLCANLYGRPWTIDGFGSSWRKARGELEAKDAIGPDLTLKGLRHTVATILAEAGHDGRTIADLLGQRTTAMGEHYSRRASRTRKNAATVASFDAELTRRASVKPSPESVKPDTDTATERTE